jgi:Flp pilus assembly protein TadB
MILVVWMAGAGCGAGAWLIASGTRRAVPQPQRTQPWLPFVRRLMGRIDQRRVGLAALGGLTCLVLVRWPVAVAAGAAGGWLAPSLGGRGSRRQGEERTEAIAQWCEMLRDAAGTARGIEGILAATAASAPDAIRPEVDRMARRLEDEPLAVALDGLAADLAHPIGDLVVTALRVAATAGSRRIAGVLGNLADAAHHEASMRRRLDVARARPRATLRLVVLIVGAFVAGLVAFADDYMAPYGSPLGQVVLVLIGVYWGLGFWWMSKLGHVPEVERVAAPSPGPEVSP